MAASIFFRWRLLVATVLLATLSLLAWYLVTGRSREAIDPQELFAQALRRTREAKSYSYRLKARLVTPQGTRSLSDLRGIRFLPDRVAVKGKMFNAPVEIIQVSGVTYIKDAFSERWIRLEGERLGTSGLFITELDPLVLLDFAALPVVSPAKKIRKKDGVLYLFTFRPEVKNPFLNAQFRDFDYRVAVDPQSCYIVTVDVTAQSKSAPTRLSVNLGLGDFGAQFRIVPPTGVD